MTEINVRVDIPALDRLCAILERKPSVAIAAPQNAPEPQQTPVQAEIPAAVPAPVQPAPVQTEPVQPEPVQTEPEKPTAKPVGLPKLQRAGASLRDMGKLDDLRALLTEFGATSLMNLPPERYDAFAGRLRELGAVL